jgi:hypothetical protein
MPSAARAKKPQPYLILLGITQLEQAGTAGILPAPLLRATDSVERSPSTGSGGQF